MKTDKKAIYVLMVSCLSLTACGLKRSPKPEEGTIITYPGMYPKPEKGEVIHSPEPQKPEENKGIVLPDTFMKPEEPKF